MKKLIFAAALSAIVFAVEAQEAQQNTPPPPPQGEVKPAPKEGKGAPRFDRAKFEERMKQRQAERKNAMIAILKKYGLDDEKAAACADELTKAQRPQRPERHERMPRPQRPEQAK